jgi:hypothetical protein
VSKNKEDVSELVTYWDDIFEFAVPKNNVTHGTERRKSLCYIFLSVSVDQIMIDLRLLLDGGPPAQQEGV